MESVFGAQSPAAPPEDHPSMRFLLNMPTAQWPLREGRRARDPGTDHRSHPQLPGVGEKYGCREPPGEKLAPRFAGLREPKRVPPPDDVLHRGIALEVHEFCLQLR